jgi:hypothetical protein
LLKEAAPPLGDDLAREVEAGGDGLILKALGGHKHNLGSDNLAIR